jgi:hypothetical protein
MIYSWIHCANSQSVFRFLWWDYWVR